MDNIIAPGKNILFYNEIAADYDIILDKDSNNEIIRKRVKEKFTGIIKAGRVLDFGGGTGCDLDWLINNNYRVIFCEPSVGMRQKAIDRYIDSADKIIFLENDKTDFTHWHNNPPFEEKIDAILSDFAVINCIEDIDLLFEILACLIKSGGHFIALMLQHGYKKTLRWKLREFARALFSPAPLRINVQYKEHQQTVFVYSPKAIAKASAAYFDMHSRENLFEFTLFYFIRK